MPILAGMNETPPSPEDKSSLGALMGRATSLALGLISLAHAALARYRAAPPPLAVARLILRRFILPAESTVRRAILVLASTLPPLVRRAGAVSEGQGNRVPPPRNEAHRLPVFRLSETLPRPAARGGQDWPRISVLDCAPPLAALPAQVNPETDEALIAARLFPRLLRRLQALEIAYLDPIAQARRYLRRRAAENAGGKPARSPLCFASIPGDTCHLHQAFRIVLGHMNTAALHTLLPAPDSS